jgi:hypothetical protein
LVCSPISADALHDVEETAVALHDEEVVKVHDVVDERWLWMLDWVLDPAVAICVAGVTTTPAVADENSEEVMWEAKPPPATIAARAAAGGVPRQATSESCGKWSIRPACRCADCTVDVVHDVGLLCDVCRLVVLDVAVTLQLSPGLSQGPPSP